MENDHAILVVVSSTVFFFLGIFVATLILLHQKKRLQNLQEEAELKIKFECEIYKSQVEVQNQTMQRIGRELHDNIGQLLTVAKIHLHILEDSPVGEKVKNTILEITEIISKIITEVRQFSHILDFDLIKNFELVESLKNELLNRRKSGGCSTELIVAENLPVLGFQKEIILFRVTQEALNNEIMPAFEGSLLVSLRTINNQFLLAIEYNGFATGQNALNIVSNQTDGAGLVVMKYKIKILGGTLKIISGDTTCTRIEIRIPL